MKAVLKGIPEDKVQEEISKAMKFKPPEEPLDYVSKVLRTPEERFEGLKGFDFKPNYCETSLHSKVKIRIHYVDEGPRGLLTVVFSVL